MFLIKKVRVCNSQSSHVFVYLYTYSRLAERLTRDYTDATVPCPPLAVLAVSLDNQKGGSRTWTGNGRADVAQVVGVVAATICDGVCCFAAYSENVRPGIAGRLSEE